ncbi:hypothetical protein F7725_019530 [Dissostichus mawsoni]|uniref:Tyrosine-protein kinase n=1 Tax=Dissostichus mawsoni TaxID=36200 RepID=A0A7J5YLE3_DISMA|nr:hypothetical protein F7725_019530 [Dissostichus mawsoni]
MGCACSDQKQVQDDNYERKFSTQASNQSNHIARSERTLTDTDDVVFMAQHDFEATNDRDLPFKKGDKLKVLQDEGEWWMAKSLETGQEGYIPCNYVARADTLEVEKWFYRDISRRETERMLLAPGNKPGAFLIRESETSKGSFSLSVRDHVPEQGDVVKHYKIRCLDKGGYYISPSNPFTSLQELVQYYTRCLLDYLKSDEGKKLKMNKLIDMSAQVIRSLDQSYRMPCPDGCPEELYNVMSMCWRQRSEERPTFEFLQNTLNDFFIATEGQYEMQP